MNKGDLVGIRTVVRTVVNQSSLDIERELKMIGIYLGEDDVRFEDKSQWSVSAWQRFLVRPAGCALLLVNGRVRRILYAAKGEFEVVS